MELKNYSTKTLINYLKDDRGVELKQTFKNMELIPYFGKIKSTSAKSIELWEGHYGLTEDGIITFCTSKGHKIELGGFLRIMSNGKIIRSPNFRNDTIIKVNKKSKVIIE